MTFLDTLVGIGFTDNGEPEVTMLSSPTGDRAWIVDAAEIDGSGQHPEPSEEDGSWIQAARDDLVDLEEVA